MTDLHFRVRGSPGDAIELPIEVRGQNLALVARTTARTPVTVNPGLYFVSALLPDGEELVASVQAQGPSTVVDLAPEPVSAFPLDLVSDELYDEPAEADILDDAAGAAPRAYESAPVQLRLINGNLFDGAYTIEEIATVTPYAGLTLQITSDEATPKPQLLQLLQDEHAPIAVAVPLAADQRCTVTLRPRSSGEWAPTLSLAHPGAELLLNFRTRGYAPQAAAAAGSLTIDAEGMLLQKMKDPIAAAVGAYALLRFAELDRLHNWTRNLYAWFPSLPDGATILGEHLARLGKHQEALDIFLELETRGLPLFTD